MPDAIESAMSCGKTDRTSRAIAVMGGSSAEIRPASRVNLQNQRNVSDPHQWTLVRFDVEAPAYAA
ncbi:hypothetical protein [Burkholderia sp. BE17]|uniref:hypothetical protein n=1 Tax=Burkholderia sp. BE17 TaxID=2656644 RepID=UPI00128D0828|nr:hypothetical protein [Burkholderia sp. BE17]MPV68455.1 hypothetical protein [Burkholderia sp. BE17]